MIPNTGLILNLKGEPNVTRYVGSTVFVDNHSDLTYAQLMPKLHAEAIVEAKLEFERICDSYGVKALHYHTYNGLFGTKDLKESYNIEK